MRMSEITQKKIILIERVLSEGYQATERDAAESQELVNQYIDELEQLEQTATPHADDIEIVMDGQVKHFSSAEFAEWLAGEIS